MKWVSKPAFCWAAYDWANSVFATTVMAAFAPIFYTDYWSKGTPVNETLFWFGFGTSAASLVAAVLSLLLGGAADKAGMRKRFLLAFAMLGACSTCMLTTVQAGHWESALVFYGLASVGFICAITFYDSLLEVVSTPDNIHFVSSFGFGLGYLGGGLFFATNVAMVVKPEWFGFDDKIEAVRLSFLLVAIWWAVFTLPLLAGVKEPHNPSAPAIGDALIASMRTLWETISGLLRHKQAVWFLVAYWFYIDGVDTIITMAAAYGKSVGFKTDDLLGTILIIQFVAFPSALVFGWLGQKFGPKPMLYAGLALYMVVTFVAARLDTVPLQIGTFNISKIYVIGILIALVQGGVQALSRSMFSGMIPPGHNGSWFGIYNLMGRFAAILGPLIFGVVTRMTDNQRIGLQSVAVLFVIGMVLLAQVPATQRHQMKP
jgi:UMF1 family MFS transporter